jgi:hypothetical protein
MKFCMTDGVHRVGDKDSVEVVVFTT